MSRAEGGSAGRSIQNALAEAVGRSGRLDALLPAKQPCHGGAGHTLRAAVGRLA